MVTQLKILISEHLCCQKGVHVCGYTVTFLKSTSIYFYYKSSLFFVC